MKEKQRRRQRGQYEGNIRRVSDDRRQHRGRGPAREGVTQNLFNFLKPKSDNPP